MAPIVRPPTVTEAEETRWTTVRMRATAPLKRCPTSGRSRATIGVVRGAPLRRGRGTQLPGRIQARVEQMPRRDVANRLEHRLLDARMLALQLHQHPFGALALQSQIAARRAAAADDRQLALFRIGARFGFAHVHERPDD